MKLNLTVAALAAGASLLFAGTAAAEVTVTTGAGYVKMVQALVDAYQSQTQAKVGTAFGGNIGQMLAQVRESGKVNLVISDATSLQKFSNELKELKTGVKLGDTPLILAWRKGIVLTGPEDLDKSDVKRVAMPDPKAAVYGRAAKEYLASSGLDKKLGDRVNIASTVPQVMSYVVRGEMDAGFVNLVAARGNKDKIGGFTAIKDGYKPVLMTAVPVKDLKAQDKADVEAFMAFLASDKATPILNKFGVVR